MKKNLRMSEKKMYFSYLRFAPNDLLLRRLCIPRGNSGTSHSALGSQWLIAFVVSDFAKGFRHAEIKRSFAPPLPIRAKSRRRLWGPRLIGGRPRPLLSPFEHSSLGTPYEKIANYLHILNPKGTICNFFWLKIWLCQKFFVPFIPQGNSGTRIFIKMLQINLHIPKILRTFAVKF